MLPLYPPYAINDLAHEHLGGRRPGRHDPDRFIDESSALQPDPVFMGLRNAVASSPVGRLMQWLDRMVEAREDRVAASRACDVSVPVTLVAPEPLHIDQVDDRSDGRNAA